MVSVDQLIQHKQFLQETQKQLTLFITKEKDRIEALKNQIKGMEDTIKQLKYYSQGNEGDSLLTDNIYKLETEIQAEKEEQNYTQMKLQNKKGLLDEVCLALSRI